MELKRTRSGVGRSSVSSSSFYFPSLSSKWRDWSTIDWCYDSEWWARSVPHLKMEVFQVVKDDRFLATTTRPSQRPSLRMTTFGRGHPHFHYRPKGSNRCVCWAPWLYCWMSGFFSPSLSFLTSLYTKPLLLLTRLYTKPRALSALDLIKTKSSGR